MPNAQCLPLCISVFSVVKGLAVKVKAKKVQKGKPGFGHRFAEANAAVVIAGVEALPAERKARDAVVLRLIPTDDPSDRAHNVHDHGAFSMLLPAKQVCNARPRRYWPCHIIEGRIRGHIVRVSIDSVYDRTYEMARELAAAGIELGVVRAADVRDFALAAMSYEEARSKTRRNFDVGMSREERKLEREATKLLGGKGVRRGAEVAEAAKKGIGH